MPLKPAVSTLARNTIKAAYDELNHTINLADKKDFPNTTLEDVKKAARSIENQLAARQSLRNMRRLMPLFRGLEHYSKVIDVLCNGTPYLPWIWAPITLILRVASEFVEAFEQIIRGYASIAESLKRFEILSDTFINEPDFQQTLAVFYADILKFHKHAYKFVRRSSWKLMFSTSWGRFQARFGNILEDLKQHGALIDLEANARDISQAKAMRDDIRKWREESEHRISQEDIEQNAKQHESIVSWLQVNEGDQIAIMESISSEVADYQDTCGWLLKNKKVSSWANNQPDTPSLWLKGPAGTGKSVLTTQLVNFMRGTKFVTCHFCTYRYAASIMYEQVLKSLLLQILRKDGDLVAHVYKTYILEKKQPTTTSLEQLLQKLLSSISNDPNKAEYLWIVIDGLDECDPDKHMRLVRLINQLTAKPVVPGGTVCKVLVSSRAPSSALERLKRSQVISLSEEKKLLSEAIRQYVDRRLRLMDKKLRQLDLEHSEIKEIQDAIVIKADGMFLYARLVMDYLASNIFFSGDEIKNSVKQLPQKLSDFYQRILTQILIQLDARSVDRIKCVFGWIAFAKRPLRKLELLSAITFSAGDPSVSRLAPQFLLEICGTLIEERHDATFAFIHNSVKEFLQSSSKGLNVEENEALQQHGAATVTCLLSGFNIFCHTNTEQDKALRVAKGLHGLHIYATEFWTEYLLSWAVSEYQRAEDDLAPLLQIACKLAASLNESPTKAIPNSEHLGKMIDKRLEFLDQHPMLQKLVNQALQARSLGNLESRVFRKSLIDQETEQHFDPLIISDGISNMLASYQEVVKSLLDQNYHSELSTEEFALFKVHFGATAYTCQLTSCSRATIGFETEELLKEHEKRHVRWFQCAVSECQFPSFLSARALKNHTRKHHTVTVTAKAIRRPEPGIGTRIWTNERPVKARNTHHGQNDGEPSQITNERSHRSLDPIGEDQTQHGTRSATNSPSPETNLPGVYHESRDELFRDLHVLSDGTLIDGREYAVDTFTVYGRDWILFMLRESCDDHIDVVSKEMLDLALQKHPYASFRISLAEQANLVRRGILSEADYPTVVEASFVFMVCGDVIIKKKAY
ncbi:hypothetical protein ACHAPA_005433 [Fusarium lateritium]